MVTSQVGRLPSALLVSTGETRVVVIVILFVIIRRTDTLFILGGIHVAAVHEQNQTAQEKCKETRIKKY